MGKTKLCSCSSTSVHDNSRLEFSAQFRQTRRPEGVSRHHSLEQRRCLIRCDRLRSIDLSATQTLSRPKPYHTHQIRRDGAPEPGSPRALGSPSCSSKQRSGENATNGMGKYFGETCNIHSADKANCRTIGTPSHATSQRTSCWKPPNCSSIMVFGTLATTTLFSMTAGREDVVMMVTSLSTRPSSLTA